MSRRKLIFLVLAFFLPCHYVRGQEMLGMTLGNYAGINGIQLNPSSLHNSKTYLDVQIIGLDIFEDNNAIYIDKKDYRFSNFFKAGYEWPTHQENFGTEERIFYQYENKNRKSAFINLRINGPGVMLITGKHAFAITTAVRSVFSLHNVPYELANFAYLGLNYRPQHNINYQDDQPFAASGMAWAEIGLAYSNTVYARRFDKISVGIGIKRLFGVGAVYANIQNLDYTVLNDSTFNIKNLKGEIGISLPLNYYSNGIKTDNILNGGGFGFDVGITYQRLSHYHQNQYYTSLCAQEYEDYLYRIGISLIDIGGIQFNNNARKLGIDNRSSYWENVTKMNFRSVNQILDTISYKFYGDTTSADIGEKFTMWLPSALSIQFDYHLKSFWYLNASLIYGFPLSRGSLARPAEISITPRYEKRWLEVSLPISLYDWTLPRIGMALRIYGFTIGTDKLGEFFNFNNFTGMDIYFSVKLFFNKGVCGNKGTKHCGNNETKEIHY
ncbi:MAG: DUF5723 family protein [Bacteroidales bacterium]|nr:DUF5723 family protein [Bacteroidales bacterium]